MSWLDEYKKKLVTADEAVKVIKSGDWVEYAFGVAGANELDAALARRIDELWDVKIRCDIGAWPHYTNEADPTGEHFYWNSWHCGGLDRKYYNQGVLSYIPMKFHEAPFMTRYNCDPTNVAMMTVSPMDKHGYFSFGAGSPSTWAAIEKAQYVIVEINTNMPRVLGGNQECIHISQVDYVVESSNMPLPTIPDVAPSETEQKIAEHIIERLYDGNCIQLGIGGIPNAMGAMIAASDLKDLGVHTEMYVDAYVKMTKAGKITGARKNIDKYKQVFSFAMGSRELYDFIDDNPGVIAYSVDYTNSPVVVAGIDDFVSINACIEVDLFGQVCSESVGPRHISGTGGQLDFVEGAYKSKNGQSFICMTSTFEGKNGLVSRIKPILTPGAIVTSPRTASHMIATEFGIADMKGKSTWERAEALINIAHPKFKDELIKEAGDMKIWRKTNKIAAESSS
ncbi:MAG: butyryl-CoA:acetate CoA-transferase [Syntrophomonadaceae bacterium]|jgi:butyryl-CoA:acetate CoA-transferase|nr:butyryl-CoA:acetate CoA-transferase [Syntrophomonadaceae bacterium]